MGGSSMLSANMGYGSLPGESPPCMPTTPPAPLPMGPAVSGSGGMKYDQDKLQPSLLLNGCAKAVKGVLTVLGFGAKKYAADSWKSVPNGKLRYRNALYRHLMAVEAGEVLDPESGLPHWDHIACNAMFLSELSHQGDK